MNMESKKETEKRNLEQISIIVDYLETNRVLITVKTNPNSMEIIVKYWHDLVAILKDKKQF